MASITSAWVHKLTGLPSFRIAGPGELRTSDGRLVARSNDTEWSVSDLFAPVGVATGYTVGGAVKTLTRVSFGPEGSCLVSDLTGRGVVVDFHEDVGEPYKFKSGANRMANGRVRANPRGDVRSGEALLVLDSPEKFEALTEVLESPGRTLLTLDRPARGARDVKCLWITQFDRTRVSHLGEFEFAVKYEWQDSDDLTVTGAPALTFGELAEAGLLWGTNKTFGQVMAMVAGGSW